MESWSIVEIKVTNLKGEKHQAGPLRWQIVVNPGPYKALETMCKENQDRQKEYLK